MDGKTEIEIRDGRVRLSISIPNELEVELSYDADTARVLAQQLLAASAQLKRRGKGEGQAIDPEAN